MRQKFARIIIRIGMSDSHNIAMITQKFERHYEESVVVNAKREKVFAYADDHRNFSSHMNKSSWMMEGACRP